MRELAIFRILAEANEDGEAFTLNIFSSGGGRWIEAKLIRFYYLEHENMLEIETQAGRHVYIDGDSIETILVNK